MRILIAASEPREFAGLVARAGRGAPPSQPAYATAADWARPARLGTDDLLLLANGVGTRRVAAAVDSACADFHPDVLVSTGFCGAVAPELGVAEIVVASEVADRQSTYAAAPLTTAPQHRRGVVRTIDHIAQTAEEKQFWRSTGAIAIEMEAAAVAECAQVRGLPFYCIKAVSDLAHETLAINLNAALRSDGHFDTMNILGSLLCQPVVRVPELLRLRSRAVRAANSLGVFFADCRF